MAEYNYQIMTDMTADLPEKYCKEKNVEVFDYPFSVDEKEYSSVKELPIKEFYALMRQGKMTRTAQITRGSLEDTFRKHLDNGRDVIFFVFSSALSGTCASAMSVAAELNEEYENNKVLVFDTLSACLGEGLFVMKAVEKAEEGLSVDELYEAYDKGELREAFGTGTAAVISPIGSLDDENKKALINDGKIGAISQRLYDTLTGIQMGRMEAPEGWIKVIC